MYEKPLIRKGPPALTFVVLCVLALLFFWEVRDSTHDVTNDPSFGNFANVLGNWKSKSQLWLQEINNTRYVEADGTHYGAPTRDLAVLPVGTEIRIEHLILKKTFERDYLYATGVLTSGPYAGQTCRLEHINGVYRDAAEELGEQIARRGWRLVYGGNCIGCMGSLADAARKAGGKVIGITPQLLVDQGIADEKCDELIVTSGMRERKALLEQHADAFITLPGGLGTLEEVFEILVGRLLGYHSKPIVLLNVANYYGPLLEMIEHGIEQRFIRPNARDAYFVAATVSQAMEYLECHGRAEDTDREPSALE